MVHLLAAILFLFLSGCLASSVQPNTAGQVHVSMSGDRTAVVHFTHGLKKHVYHLEATSVFAEGAEIISHTDEGEERVKAPAFTSFRAVEDGHRATARIHADGSVTGLFEHEDAILRLAPSHKPRNASWRVGRSLREEPRSFVAAGRGEAAHMHDFSYLPPLDLLGKSRETPRRRMHGDDEDAVAITSNTLRRLSDPTLYIDKHKDFTPEDQRSDLPSDEMPRIGASTPRIAAMTNWAGQRWYPRCYPNDDKLNEFHVGVILDNEAWKLHSEDIQEHITEAVEQASLVYEKQMHLRIKIGEFKIFKSESGAPAYAVGCPPEAQLMETKLNQLRQGSGYSFMGSTHLFTGCGTDYGVVGLAYLGTICNKRKFNTGVDQIHDYNSENTFLIFAHELGHNYGGDHSFEDGQGTTGGIMDYGDGHLNGVYQFNTKYRKGEMCETLSRVAGNCQGKFVVAANQGPTPTPPPSTPAPGPTPTPPPTPPPPTLPPSTPTPTPPPTPRPDGGTGPCKTVSHRGAGIGQECVFPFEFKGITYHGCTPEGHVNIWCPTEGGVVNGKTDGPQKGGGNWGECSWSPQCIGLDSPCKTTEKDSDNEGKPCRFPFKYSFAGIESEYRTCTRVGHNGFWCATEVDENGAMTDWANCENTDYCWNFWKTMGWAGIPEDKVWELGNQAANKWNWIKQTGQKQLGKVKSRWQKFKDFWQWVWCKITSGFKGECAQDEEPTASDGDLHTVSGVLVGKSQVFRGQLMHPGPRWGWAVASSAGLGFGLLMAAAFAVKRALRISSFQALNASPSSQRATNNSDDGCEQEQALLIE